MTCDCCGERTALFRLTTHPPLRCFECIADDPALPAGHHYKHALERRL